MEPPALHHWAAGAEAHDLSVRCPVCSGPVEVVRVRCPRCEVSIDGRFRLLEFNLLSPQHLELLRMFVRTRGNLKEMGRLVGVSYPTIRARFEELLTALGYEATPDVGTLAEERQAVLEALERGEIGAGEAAARLRRLAGGDG